MFPLDRMLCNAIHAVVSVAIYNGATSTPWQGLYNNNIVRYGCRCDIQPCPDGCIQDTKGQHGSLGRLITQTYAAPPCLFFLLLLLLLYNNIICEQNSITLIN